jgi:hypothetical protein
MNVISTMLLRVQGDSVGVGRYTGQLPVTLTRPDRGVMLLKKTPISIFVRSFYRSLIASFNRQGGPYPPVYSLCHSSTIERTFVVLSAFAIGPDRLTGSSPLPYELLLQRPIADGYQKRTKPMPT